MDVLDSTVDVSTGVEKMLAPVDLPACTVLRRGFSSTRAGETTKEVLHSFRRRARAISHFGDSYDDMNFTPPLLARIQANACRSGRPRPALSSRAVDKNGRVHPHASLCTVPDAGHDPFLGEKGPDSLKTAAAFRKR